MKTPRLIRSVCLPGLLTAGSLLPAAPEQGQPAYTLFMGADIAIERGKSFHRVEDVEGSFFKIVVDGKQEMVSTRNGTSRMRIDNTLKLAGTPVSFENLTTERSYTPARDPQRKLARMSGMASAASSSSDLAGAAVGNAALALQTASADPNAPAGLVESMQSAYDSSVQAQQQAFSEIGSELNSVGTHADAMERELAQENFDAIRVSMELSSPERIEDPYLLVIARIHERDEKAGVFRNWIFAQKLEAIDSKPRKIHINQGGLPEGYTLEDCQVRIYSRGRELPTSVSPNSISLSRDEARQYLLIEHVAANKGGTMPALPVFGEAPADLKARLAAGEFTQPYFVRVDAEGNALGTFIDRECSRPADDPYVESFVAHALFVPALEKGKAVPGVARLQLGALIN